MILSIRTKLFLALLGTGTLVAMAMLAFMAWSFERGLIELVHGREQRQIAAIAERLAEVYRRDGGWKVLRGDRHLWVTTLFGRAGGAGPGMGARLSGQGPGPGPHRRQRDLMQPGVWPPARALEPPPADAAPQPVELRLMLLDAAGDIVYGRPQLLSGTSRLPVEIDSTKIGELALLPGPSAADLGEIQFQARHARALVLIAVGMIALSALVAFALARRLVRPVQGFQETARRLAGGDLAARVAATGDDELGHLGQDINTLAETLEANEQARRRWVADISHELRTPLALLRAQLEALQDGVRPLDRPAVDALHGDTLRLGRVVDDLYDLSMTDLGAQSYHKTEIDPVQVLDDDVEAYRPRFAAAGLSLTLDDRLGRPVRLLADSQRLSQLFRNLLRNSLRYTDPGEGLTVTLQRAGAGLVIDFQDSPPGVPEDALPRLFERLYRVEGSRSRDTGGAGLGLAIARNICEAHGGRIEARTAPQGGLWIHVELPLREGREP
jgi:two-component system, OmpR family, sensor histidine kinase BaeS